MLNFLLNPITQIRELTLISVILRILISALIGGVLGIERGTKNRPAGLRTYMLVCMGAATVMITNQYVTQTMGFGDPVRMGAQVVSGIGFLGAGSIIVTSKHQIMGLTTAAGLWAAACVGLAVGIGFYEVGVVCGLLIMLILTTLNRLDSITRRESRVVTVYIELSTKEYTGEFIHYLRENSINMHDFEIAYEHLSPDAAVGFIITINSNHGLKREEMLSVLNGFKGLVYIDEL